ncbi:MAG TPA: LptA/OstA family protein, partial [Candidatus Obscuribacter sp.]|nr:LptA/OstA family protein [Candidatus Obscuribacter sp.]
TGSGSAAASEPAPTKIITDADKQVYDKATGQFEAYGKVRVRAGDINVTADALKMAYGVDTKPEAAIFTGHVSATQGTNNTQADRMTYFLNTKRLQADGHVRSKVIQQGRGTSQPAPVQPTTQEPTSEPIVNGATGKGTLMQAQPLVNGGSKVGFSFSEGESTAPIIIVSDSQDYSKETGRLTAFGNVKIFYQDTVGIGPKVILVRNVEGQAERVYFVGRSQITQPGKRWIADKIVMTVADRKVLAEGNTRAIILPKKQAEPASNFQLAQSQKKQLSSSRVEMAQ